MIVEYDDKRRTFEDIEVGETFVRAGDLHFMKTENVKSTDGGEGYYNELMLNCEKAGGMINVSSDSPVTVTRMKMVES